MFVRCRKCGWEQDDFWSEEYNPIRSLNESLEILLEHMTRPHSLRRVQDGRFNMPHRTGSYLAVQLEKSAKRLRDMHWWTAEDFANDPDRRCPECASKSLTVD